MAVQAQYPSNILLLTRNVQESTNNLVGTNDYSLDPCNNNGVGVNPRKRGREIGGTTTTTHTTTTTRVNSFNFCQLQNQQLQNHNDQIIDLSQHQNRQQQQQQQQHYPSLVSTGLKLSFGDQKQHIQQNPQILSNFSDELAFQFKQQSDELNYFLHAQGEQLKRTLAEKRQKHYYALVGVAGEAVARQVQKKEAELETAARRNAELEAQAAQLTTEAQAWQARARAQEAQAVSLQAQIQQAIVGPSSKLGGPPEQNGDLTGDADDAESVYIDPTSERRAHSPSCKACRIRDASVVLLPCRHMCVCVQCDEHVQACPVCFLVRSASVEVYFT